MHFYFPTIIYLSMIANKEEDPQNFSVGDTYVCIEVVISSIMRYHSLILSIRFQSCLGVMFEVERRNRPMTDPLQKIPTKHPESPVTAGHVIFIPLYHHSILKLSLIELTPRHYVDSFIGIYRPSVFLECGGKIAANTI